MRIVARIMKVINVVPKLVAPRMPHMAVIEHTGRSSGNLYRTPVMAFVEGDAISIVLNYGTTSDWVRNVQAAGSADVVHQGRRYRLTDPRVIPTGSAELPPVVRAMRAKDRSALHGVLAASTPG
ncbi:hypothetical protein A9W96_29475 [Mycobacterium sp. 1245852.3]|nr:hypothetical protein A9W96_29475 [Mycobacterium sp. 1245852.3]